MYATQYNIKAKEPKDQKGLTVGRYLYYPCESGCRKAEGGLRTQRVYKQTRHDLPLVSIITVCLNSETTLEQCIRSVLQQTYNNLEYIIVDGASNDGTLNVIEEYADGIDYYISERDRGLYHAMNKGLSLASGDFILFLNSDDWYEIECVEKLVEAKSYAGTSFVSALARVVDEEGVPVRVLKSRPFDPGLRLGMTLRHETMLLSAQIYNDVGPYDDSYRIIADLQLATRVFESQYSHYEVPRVLLNFRNTGVSSKNTNGRLEERERLFKEIFPFLAPEDLRGLSKPTPKVVESLVRKYSIQTEFMRTLKCFVEDRSAWINPLMDWEKITRARNLPLISVILPICGVRETLAACIDSVLAQTLENFELICIDEKKSDGTQKIVEAYQQRDSRIILLINEESDGVAEARNAGVQAAKGNYILHVDPEVVLCEKAAEKLYACAVRYGSDLVKGAYLREQALYGEPSKLLGRVGLKENSPPIVDTDLARMPELLESTDDHWAYLYRSEFAKRVPYPTDLQKGRDNLFLIHALAKARSVTITSALCCRYRADPNDGSEMVFREYLDAIEWRRRAWHLLNDAGLRAVGDMWLQVYWGGESFFRNLGVHLTQEQINVFLNRFRRAVAEAGIKKLPEYPKSYTNKLFSLILARDDEAALALVQG